jgi:thiaminase/transcriptional activator TenA
MLLNCPNSDKPEHKYIDLIRTYSSRDFEDLADRYASDISLICATYRYAMECERDFFQAAKSTIADFSPKL